MFTLDRQAFRGADTSVLPAFVSFWERYYRDSVSISPTDGQPIDYFAELGLDSDLSEQNLSRLLRWKDPRLLTHPKTTPAGPEPNPRVMRVLAQLDALNAFRRGDITATAFEHEARRVFSTGIVWQLFLFHIARPWEWPIADQHVFRAQKYLFGVQEPKSLRDFEQYRSSFATLAATLLSQSAGDATNRLTAVSSNKRLDNALMAYGQFLAAYDR